MGFKKSKVNNHKSEWINKLTVRFSVCCENCTNLVINSCNSIIVGWNWWQELWTGKWEVVCKFFSVSAIDKLFKHVLQIRNIKRCDRIGEIWNDRDGEDWTNVSDIWIITRWWGFAGLYSICTLFASLTFCPGISPSAVSGHSRQFSSGGEPDKWPTRCTFFHSS